MDGGTTTAMPSCRSRRKCHCFLCFLLLTAASLSTGVQAQPYGSILSLINTHPNLTILRSVVQGANLTSVLSNAALNVTAFLPNDNAFVRFAASQGLPDTDALAAQPPAALARLMRYHLAASVVRMAGVVDVRTGNVVSDAVRTLLTSRTFFSPTTLDTAATLWFTGSLVAGKPVVYVIGTRGSNATVLTADMRAGTSLVNIVDTVLEYWHDTIAEALLRARFFARFPDQFQQGLREAGLWDQMSDPAANYTVLVPSEPAFQTAYGEQGLGKAIDSHLQDVVMFHVIQGPVHVGCFNRYPAYIPSIRSTDGFNQLLINCTVTGTPGPSGVTRLSYTPYIRGADTQAELLPGGVYPVGGLVTRAWVYCIDQVLLPVFSSVGGYLRAQPDDYGTLANLVDRMRVTMPAFPSPKPEQTVVFLAPNNRAMDLFQRDTGFLPHLQSDKDRLWTFLVNHVITPAFDTTTLRTGDMLSTRLSVFVVNITNNTISLKGSRNRAVVRGAAPILYSTSYVMDISYPMIPVALGNAPGAAAPTRPPHPLLLAAASLLTAAVLARWVGVGPGRR